MDGKPKRGGRWWKILLGALVLLAAAVAVVLVNIDAIAHSQANRAIERIFAAGGRLDRIEIDIGDGAVAVAGLSIRPPDGFGDEPFLTLGELTLDIDPLALIQGEIVVEELTVRDLSLVLVRDTDGRLSPRHLLRPSQTGTNAPTSENDTDTQAPPALPAIRVDTLRLEAIAVRVIDRMGGTEWGARASIEMTADELRLTDLAAQDISVNRLNLALHDLSIDQPEGFGKTPLMRLERFELAASGIDAASPPLSVQRVAFQKPAAALIVRADGVSNLQRLIASLMPEETPAADSATAPRSDHAAPASGNRLPAVGFESIAVEDGALYLRDDAITKTGLEIPIQNARMAVSGLRLFDSATDATPASADVSFELRQPGELPTAIFGTVATIGPIHQMPPLNAQVRLIGFKLDTLGELIPPATRAALGAGGLDLEMAMALGDDAIDLFASILTDRGIRYNAVHAYGPVKEPTVEVADVISGAFDRISDGLVNLGVDGLKAGVDIAAGGVEVVGEVGAGAWNVTKSLGIGVVGVGAGLLTLDQGKMKKGMERSTKGTVRVSADAVRGGGSAVGGGVTGALSDVTGQERVRAWEQEIPSRYTDAMARAEAALAGMPYPPDL